MTDTAQNDDCNRPAGAGPVQRSVRPRAWEVRQGSRTFYVSDAEFVRRSYDSGEFVPLYPPEAVDAERERCAKVAEAEDVSPTDCPIGAQQCIAASIRRA